MAESMLQKPAFDTVLAIDERLKQLEIEAQAMEQKFQYL